MKPSPPDMSMQERRAQPRGAFRKRRRRRERVHILGQPVDLLKPEEVLHHTQLAISEGRKSVVANHNLHSLYLIQRHSGMRAFYDRAELVEVDSTPLIWFSRALGLHSRGFHRCTYLDWREHFWSLANRLQWRIMSIGGEPGVGELARERLLGAYPEARIATHHGFFDMTHGGAENTALLERIQAYRPHILFVGMGMPRQETWIAENFDALPDCVIFSVGAAFDYEAGVQKAAPRWMGRLGLEWAFRLVADPRRLFTRYCVEPWSLVPLALADIGAAWRRRRNPSGNAAPEFGSHPQSGARSQLR